MKQIMEHLPEARKLSANALFFSGKSVYNTAINRFLQDERMNTEAEKRTEAVSKAERPRHSARTVLLTVLCLLIIAAAVLALADGRHPQFYMMTGQETETPLGEPYEDPGVYAVLTGRVFGEGKKHLPVQTEGSVDTSRLGSYELVYRTDFLFREYRCTRTVCVVDRTPPVITLNYRKGYYVNWIDGYEEEGCTAWDNVDGDVTALVTAERQGDGIIYAVSDSSGNEARVERRPDYTVGPPHFLLTGGDDLRIPADFSFSDPGFSAADSFGNDLTGFVQVQGSVIPWRSGTYELRYSVTNRMGDMESTVRRVTVEPVKGSETVEPEEKTIYLTFDDGPGPYTDRLLDILDKYGVKATFFVTCDQPDYFHCTARAWEAGHAVGIHSASHEYNEIYAGEEAFFEDFQKVRDMIFDQTGEYPTICRFPGGSSNTVSSFTPGIMTRLASYVRDLGYQYFDWDVYSGDAGGKGATTKSDTVFANVTEGIGGMHTAVILQHDIKGFSVDAVERIILWGFENGYTFRALDAGSPPAHLDIAN